MRVNSLRRCLVYAGCLGNHAAVPVLDRISDHDPDKTIYYIIQWFPEISRDM